MLSNAILYVNVLDYKEKNATNEVVTLEIRGDNWSAGAGLGG